MSHNFFVILSDSEKSVTKPCLSRKLLRKYEILRKLSQQRRTHQK